MNALERLQALEQEASKGPWWVAEKPNHRSLVIPLGGHDTFRAYIHGEGNPELIAALRNAAPDLIAVAVAAQRLSEVPTHQSGAIVEAYRELDAALAKLEELGAD